MNMNVTNLEKNCFRICNTTNKILEIYRLILNGFLIKLFSPSNAICKNEIYY
jgi:hypothetical protein